MKMTSSTSMTSMSGVTLISFIPPRRRLPRPPPVAIAISDASEFGARGDVLGETFHAVGDDLDSAREVVVRHDGGNGRDEPDGGRDKCFGDFWSDDGQVRVLLVSDAQKRVHDSVDRAEKADEWRCRPDGS